MSLFMSLLMSFGVFFCQTALAEDISVNYSLAPLEVHVKFGAGKTINGAFDQNKTISYYWISGVAPEQMLLTLSEQHLLLAFLAKHKPAQNDNETLIMKFIEFSANVIPAEEIVHPYQKKLTHTDAPEWNSICGSFGKNLSATFTIGAQSFNQNPLVGGPRCSGRCGMGCKQVGQAADSTRYTQECLNHDMCKDTTGKIMGPCEDEFWKAAPGYLAAPNCF